MLESNNTRPPLLSPCHDYVLYPRTLFRFPISYSILRLNSLLDRTLEKSLGFNVFIPKPTQQANNTTSVIV